MEQLALPVLLALTSLRRVTQFVLAFAILMQQDVAGAQQELAKSAMVSPAPA